MIDQESLLELKDKYWNLYYVDINGYEFLFRELSRLEYKKVLRTLEDVQEQEDRICKICVIEPEDFDYENCPAGIPESLANFILIESGFITDTGKLSGYLERYRSEMDTFDNQMSCIIHEAFPTLTLEEIEDWPMEKAAYYLTRAEYILKSLRGLELEYVPAQGEVPQQTKRRQPIEPVRPVQQEPVEKSNSTILQNELAGEHSDIADFPELSEIKRFMDGKLFK